MKKLLLLLVLLAQCSGFLFAQGQIAPQPINVMSYNIRMDNAGDGDNQWKFRKEFAANLVKFHEADLIGMQEVLHNQLMDMASRLPDYGYIGVGREDGRTKGEYASIFYNKKRFKVIDSGNFWLSEDCDAVGKKGWDAACERVATWGVFEDKSTGKRLFMLNTHLDHIGKVARHEGALLVINKVKELSRNYPVIVTGDFNAVPTDDPIQVLTNSPEGYSLTDTRSVSPLVYGPNWSFHDFGRVKMAERSLIDYIFIKGNIKVMRYGVLTDMLNAFYPSDHCPVLSTLIIQ